MSSADGREKNVLHRTFGVPILPDSVLNAKAEIMAPTLPIAADIP